MTPAELEACELLLGSTAIPEICRSAGAELITEVHRLIAQVRQQRALRSSDHQHLNEMASIYLEEKRRWSTNRDRLHEVLKACDRYLGGDCKAGYAGSVQCEELRVQIHAALEDVAPR